MFINMFIIINDWLKAKSRQFMSDRSGVSKYNLLFITYLWPIYDLFTAYLYLFYTIYTYLCLFITYHRYHNMFETIFCVAFLLNFINADNLNYMRTNNYAKHIVHLSCEN